MRMELERTMSDEARLKSILETAGVYHSATWYSGAGPNERDLGSEHLRKIYDGIRETFGEEASASFVALIRGLTSLAPTSFLTALWNLFWTKWEMPQSVETPGRVYLDPRLQSGMQMGMTMIAGLVGARSSSPRQDAQKTSEIREGFLWSVRDRFPPTAAERDAQIEAYNADLQEHLRFRRGY